MESYTYFMNNLVDTVRDKIGDCAETAYETLPMADATTMLMFNSTDEVISYIESSERDWKVMNNEIHFQLASKHEKLSIPSAKFIEEQLSYASELERIV